MSSIILAILGAGLVGLSFDQFASVLHMSHGSLFVAGFNLTLGLFLAFASHSLIKEAK